MQLYTSNLPVYLSCFSLYSVGLDRVIILWDLITMSCQKVVPVFESLSGIVLQHPERTAFPGAKTDDDHVYAMVVGDKGK